MAVFSFPFLIYHTFTACASERWIADSLAELVASVPSQTHRTQQPPHAIDSNCPADCLLSTANWENFLQFALAESSTTNPTCRQLVTVELSPVAHI